MMFEKISGAPRFRTELWSDSGRVSARIGPAAGRGPAGVLILALARSESDHSPVRHRNASGSFMKIRSCGTSGGVSAGPVRHREGDREEGAQQNPGWFRTPGGFHTRIPPAPRTPTGWEFSRPWGAPAPQTSRAGGPPTQILPQPFMRLDVGNAFFCVFCLGGVGGGTVRAPRPGLSRPDSRPRSMSIAGEGPSAMLRQLP